MSPRGCARKLPTCPSAATILVCRPLTLAFHPIDCAPELSKIPSGTVALLTNVSIGGRYKLSTVAAGTRLDQHVISGGLLVSKPGFCVWFGLPT